VRTRERLVRRRRSSCRSPASPPEPPGKALLAGAERPAVVVPKDAILSQGGLELVVLRGDEGTTTTRLVRRGAAVDADRVEILSGLVGGETLLVGLGSVPPAGSPVEVVSP
jgi:hypothetical protein